MWFTQSLGYIHQQKVQYYYYPVITICNPSQLNTILSYIMKSLTLSLFIQAFFAYKIRPRISRPIGKVVADAFCNIRVFFGFGGATPKNPHGALPLNPTLYCTPRTLPQDLTTVPPLDPVFGALLPNPHRNNLEENCTE